MPYGRLLVALEMRVIVGPLMRKVLGTMGFHSDA